jgi:hypothetical protein|nr:MAG TPA: hypothetical protein [Caudoviricetes sp.]
MNALTLIPQMEQTKTPKRSIAASAELKAKLAEMWNVTPRMVNKALLEWSDSRLAHVIRRTAMEHGAVVMVSALECETIHTSNGKMRQTFANGAVLEVTMQTGRCVVTHYNKVVKEVEILTLEELDALQQEVAALK